MKTEKGALEIFSIISLLKTRPLLKLESLLWDGTLPSLVDDLKSPWDSRDLDD